MGILITEKDVKNLLTMELAICSLEEIFKKESIKDSVNSSRIRINLPEGSLNFMAASSKSLNLIGTKSYIPKTKTAIKFYVQLYDGENGNLLSVIEANLMSRIRTGAASGLATKYLAKKNSSVLGIIGTGTQALHQAIAICKVRKIKTINIYSRNVNNRKNFCALINKNINNVNAISVKTSKECVENADIITTITNSDSPVFSSKWIKPGTHINAAGSNVSTKREIDKETISKASTIVTDNIDQAKIECGDLIQPINIGITSWDKINTLSDLITGKIKGRSTDNEITIFESQGVAIEDLAIGSLLYDLAVKKAIN
ncbi:MAG: ornithine cyclodeaminase family protein [SAR202 cluster bacterium]|nr:ornithine cyclodeaminase family protein [SAR202 cluster bacterium]